MPLLRYFVFVGGALLALLFVCDAVLPQVPLPGNLTSSGSDLPAIRIRSDRKWPDRVVFDTTIPSIAPMRIAKAEIAPVPPANDASAKARVREAFAQLPPSQLPPSQVALKQAGGAAATVASEPSKTELKAELKPQPKRKVAKVRPASRPVMLVAQQPHYGLFDTTW